MNRKEAQDAAVRIATALTVFEDAGDEAGADGVRLSAILMAEVVARRGAVDPQIWLSWCGIYPKGKEKTFRGEAKLTAWERVQEAMDRGDWPAQQTGGPIQLRA